MKKFWESLTEILGWASVACIAPGILSFGFWGLWHLGNHDGARAISIFVGIISALIGFGAVSDDTASASDDAKLLGFIHLMWCIVGAVIAMGTSISVTRTTMLIASITWTTTGIIMLCRWISARKLAKEEARLNAEKEAAEAKHKALVKNINKLIGDAEQTKALLAAIDRLTKYVPEVAERLLTAVADDAERYVMLRGLESTTENEVLSRQCKDEADQIGETARKLCADSTQMALELLTEYQSIESDSKLGEERGPKLARAYAEFKQYTDGLRETEQIANDRSLKQTIEALGPEAEVKALREPARDQRRLGSGN